MKTDLFKMKVHQEQAISDGMRQVGEQFIAAQSIVSDRLHEVFDLSGSGRGLWRPLTLRRKDRHYDRFSN